LNLLTLYVYRNFFESFSMGFFIFNFLIIVTSQLYQVVKWLADGVYGVFDIVKYLVFISPMYLNYVLPLSVVFGVVVSIGRLSSNFEIIALNSFGISIMYVFKRLFLVVLLISILHVVFNEFWGYRYVSYALDMYYSASKQFRLKDFSFTFDNRDSIQYVFIREYWDDVGVMKDVFIVVRDKRDNYIKKTFVASLAKRLSPNLWELYNVVIIDYNDRSKVFMDKMNYVFNFFLDSNSRKRHREELNIFEIIKYISEYKNKQLDYLVLDLYVKLNLKFIFPFGSLFLFCLVFPFSLTKLRVSNFWGIVLSIVVAFFYYVFITLFQILVYKNGIILFLWIPNFMSIILGGFFLFLKNKNYV